MKRLYPYLLSAFLALTIILFTGWIAFYSHTSISILHDICFYFHLIPFGIGFTGGSTFSMFLYYFVLWCIISLFMIPFVKAYNSHKNKRIVFIVIISLFTLGSILIIWIDQSVKKERDDRISQNKEVDKKNFKSLQTGDIIFQISKDSAPNANRIAMINLDIYGYTVLEITDRVQHSSLRLWTERNKEYTVKRLKNAEKLFTEQNIKKFRTERQKFIYKSFDSYYCWSDNKIYDAELVWKTYKRALDIELCKLDTSSAINDSLFAQENCSQNYFISTVALFDSDKLITILKN